MMLQLKLRRNRKTYVEYVKENVLHLFSIFNNLFFLHFDFCIGTELV